VQLRDLLTPPAALGQRLDLALAQRHQGDLGAREHPADEQEEADQQDVGERSVHGVPAGRGYAGLVPPSMAASVDVSGAPTYRPTCRER
jgi:hypothetical protein